MLYILLIIGLVLLSGVVFIFNRLVSRRQMVAEGWSGVDVQLKRRADLIPNLVDIVKAYANHERGLFEDITRLRGQVSAEMDVASRSASEAAITSGLGRLMAVAEDYPEIKANQNFLSLQEDLSEVEDDIQKSRRYYNGAVRNMNISVQSFPSNIIAATFGFGEAEFFQLDNVGERNAPRITMEP